MWFGQRLGCAVGGQVVQEDADFAIFKHAAQCAADPTHCGCDGLACAGEEDVQIDTGRVELRSAQFGNANPQIDLVFARNAQFVDDEAGPEVVATSKSHADVSTTTTAAISTRTPSPCGCELTTSPTKHSAVLVDHFAADQVQDVGCFFLISRLAADHDFPRERNEINLAVRIHLGDPFLKLSVFEFPLLVQTGIANRANRIDEWVLFTLEPQRQRCGTATHADDRKLFRTVLDDVDDRLIPDRHPRDIGASHDELTASLDDFQIVLSFRQLVDQAMNRPCGLWCVLHLLNRTDRLSRITLHVWHIDHRSGGREMKRDTGAR